MKLKWRVSMPALIMKAKGTGAITPRKAKTLFSEMSRLGYRKSEPVRIDHDECKPLSKIIIAHRHDLKYLLEDLLKLTFCTTEDQFQRRYEPTTEPRLRVVG